MWWRGLGIGVLCGCSGGVDVDTPDRGIDSGFERRDTAGPGPVGDPPDDTVDADCPPQLSPACQVDDGVCVDEGTTLAVAALDDAAIAAVRAAHAAGSCAPEVLLPCTLPDGAAGVAHAFRTDKGVAVDVFDGAGWVGGWVPAGPQLSYVDCGETWWLGAVRWRTCADEARAALTALDSTCVATDGTCAVASCLTDTLP